VAEKKKQSMKAAKLAAREASLKEYNDKLDQFAKRAKALCKKTEDSEKSTLELGKVLLEVRTYNPHGGLKKWIQENIGSDVSTMNRCKYAISLADPKSQRNQKRKSEPKSEVKVNWGEQKDIRKELPRLMKAVVAGNVAEAEMCRNIIMGAVDAMVKRTEYFAFKRARNKHAINLKASGHPTGEKILATEFDGPTIDRELYSEQIPREARARGYEKTADLDFTGRQQAEKAEKAEKAAATTA
jgi:hypothetical protein